MAHIYDRLTCIATPHEGIAGCATASDYERVHQSMMAAKRRAYPALPIRAPWAHPDRAQPFIVGGKWVVVCECGDAPMASPAWDEARCFQCGAIYTQIAWPADRDAIENVLLARPSADVRVWLPTETVEDLRAQNREHQLPEERDR